jgi:hypothetical protein
VFDWLGREREMRKKAREVAMAGDAEDGDGLGDEV